MVAAYERCCLEKKVRGDGRYDADPQRAREGIAEPLRPAPVALEEAHAEGPLELSDLGA
jgi:hypothetical protein